ncbi:MAG: HlyD family efflux transporter periplasmic adaptor subunit [Alphaproteobacteria bacterium]
MPPVAPTARNTRQRWPHSRPLKRRSRRSGQQIEQAQSTTADTTTSSYAAIRAPMDGTVVSVAIKFGQTINATQQSPTILRIADLSTMTAWTQVSEADIPRLKVGMPAYLTTLGNANTRHPGKLRQILPTPEIQNNVVLYDALFDVPNEDGSLMTQMTAQVFFEVASARNVLTIPVSGLQMGRATGTRRGEGRGNRAGPNITDEPHAASREGRANGGGGGNGRRQFVLVIAKDGTLERRAVVVGVSNRISAEIKSGLEEGETVVVGRKQTKAPAAANSNSNQRSMLQAPGGFGGGPGGRGPR